MIKSVRKSKMNTLPASSTMSSTASPSKKTVAKKTVAAAAPASVPAPVVEAPAPIVEAPAAKRVARSARSPAPASVATPTPTPVVTEAASVPEPVAASADSIAESSWHDDLTGLTRHLATMRDTISTLFTEVKRLEKKVQRTVKDAGKRRKNRKVEAGADDAPKRPTVFKIPQQVSDALNAFLGEPSGTLISRADVTKRVTAYAKAHSLMSGHAINADSALTALLTPSAFLKPEEKLSIFTLQKCLVQHYPKKAVAPVASA